MHAALYQRIHDFCTKYTPEVPAEIVVNAWLNKLYTSDLRFHMLVHFDDNFNIIEHAVVEVQPAFNVMTVQCHQAQLDKPSISHAVQLMEYLDKLKAEVNAACIVFSMSDNRYVKQFEKRHGYKVFRTILIKTDSEAEEVE